MVKVTSEKIDSNTIAFEIEGMRHTIPNLLRTKLWEEKDVDFAAYEKKHPYVGNPRIIVRSKNPQKSLQNAIKTAEAEIEEFRKAFEKEF